MATQALVLSGGGVVGIAWETGIAKGLLDGGIDVAETDLIVGTSAGSVLGSQLACGRSLSDCWRRCSRPTRARRRSPSSSIRQPSWRCTRSSPAVLSVTPAVF